MPLVIALFLGACVDSEPSPQPVEPVSSDWVAGSPRHCEADGAPNEDFREVAADRGLNFSYEKPDFMAHPGISGAEVSAVDLDNDGDVDLSFGRPDGFPRVFENDGRGVFREVEQPLVSISTYESHHSSHQLVDLSGDGLLDLVLFKPGQLELAVNLDGLHFAPPTVLLKRPSDEGTVALTGGAFGDVDGDGDLDLLLPGLDRLYGGVVEVFDGTARVSHGSVDYLVYNDDGRFERFQRLEPFGRVAGYALFGLLTDLDGDGDLDAFVPSDRGEQKMPPNALYRNDGLDADGFVRWTDVAPALGLDLSMSGMGMVVGDFNQDAVLDYGLSDVGGLRWLLSDASGAYVDGAAAQGLYSPLLASEPSVWFGWSMQLTDLDNDGWSDLAVSGGSPVPINPHRGVNQPNGLWRGGPDGFVEWSAMPSSYDSVGQMGLVSADFIGDGRQQLVIWGVDGPPRFLEPPCTSGNWLSVRLVGNDKSPEARGARITLWLDGRKLTREIHGMRGFSQSPFAQHFGLGAVETVEKAQVRWLDGSVSEAVELSVNRPWTVHQPQAE